MHTLYIFNPDNDLALARDVANFTPPPHAAQIARDLCTIPYFLADSGDYVLVQTELQKQWITDIERKLNRGIIGVTDDEVAHLPITHVSPWGWSRSIKSRLLRLGVSESLLPSDEDLSRIRYAASRERTVEVMRELRDTTYAWLECPTRCDEILQIKEFITTHTGTVLKAPWSSSGKGIYIPNSPNERPMEQWSQGIINRQGFVIAEPLYDKLLDFAMEFRVCRGLSTQFAGYSVFCNDTHNSFDYGLVASDLELETIICREGCVSAEKLREISSNLCKIIHSQIGNIYDGYVGVDMMVCVCSDGKRFINPCVEINLRCTMGVIANKIARYMTEGKFMVRYYSDTDEYSRAIEEITSHGGTILNAIDPSTHFLACVV